MRQFDAVHIAHRLIDSQWQLTLDRTTESARCRDALAGKLTVLQYAQRIGQVGGQLIHAFLLLRIRILHRPGVDRFHRSTGIQIDHTSMRDHFGMNVPVGNDAVLALESSMMNDKGTRSRGINTLMLPGRTAFGSRYCGVANAPRRTVSHSIVRPKPMRSELIGPNWRERARKNPLRLATVRSGSFVDLLMMNSVRRLLFC